MADDKKEDNEVVRLNMTPMIDVVFQLIVFFLVTMKFKTLDMKIEAFLPKDRGLAATMVTLDEKPKITATLQRKRGEAATRIKVANQLLGDTSPERAQSTWDTLTDKARKMREAHAANGGDPKEVKGEVDAGELVPTADVVRAVDAFIAADLVDVTFIGAPPPGSALDQVKSELPQK